MESVFDILTKEEHFFSYTELSPVPLCILRLASEKWGPRFHYNAPWMNRCALVYIIRGKGFFRTLHGDVALGPGMVFVFGGHAKHECWCDPNDPMQHLIVVYSGSKAMELTQAAFGDINASLTVVHPAELQTILTLMVSEARMKNASSHDICVLLLRALLLKIEAARQMEKQKLSPSLLTYLRCRKHMEEHCQRLRSVKEIAEACHVDAAYLCRLFARHAKESPYQYLMRLKLSRATHLLTTSDQSIKQIADELKFADPYTFSRAFRRHMRQSPQQYRTKPCNK